MHNKQLFYLVKVMASCKMACRDFAKLRAFFGAKAVGIRAAARLSSLRMFPPRKSRLSRRLLTAENSMLTPISAPTISA